MVIYFNLTKDGYLTGWSSTQSTKNDVKVYVNRDHEVLTNPEVFKYVDGELIKDENRQQQLIKEYEQEQNKLSIEDQNSIAVLELAESIAALGVTGLSTQLGGK